MIRHNWSYKLLALAVSLTLWSYVNSERNPQSVKTFTVPIEIHNIASGYIAEPRTSETTVKITGLKSVVDSVQRDDVIAWVDMGGVRTNKSVAERVLGVNTRISGISESDPDISAEATPVTALVAIEAITQKRLPVEVKFTSAAPPGYSYGEPVLSPEAVGVSGKATVISHVRRVILNVPNQVADGPVDDYFDLIALNEANRPVDGVQMHPAKVRLKVDFVQEPQTKTVIVSPNIIGQPKYPYRVSRVAVTPSAVTLQGKPRLLMGISTVTTDKVSLEGATAVVSDDVSLRLPTGVDVVGRGTVRVTIFIAPPGQQR